MPSFASCVGPRAVFPVQPERFAFGRLGAWATRGWGTEGVGAFCCWSRRGPKHTPIRVTVSLHNANTHSYLHVLYCLVAVLYRLKAFPAPARLSLSLSLSVPCVCVWHVGVAPCVGVCDKMVYLYYSHFHVEGASRHTLAKTGAPKVREYLCVGYKQKKEVRKTGAWIMLSTSC